MCAAPLKPWQINNQSTNGSIPGTSTSAATDAQYNSGSKPATADSALVNEFAPTAVGVAGSNQAVTNHVNPSAVQPYSSMPSTGVMPSYGSGSSMYGSGGMYNSGYNSMYSSYNTPYNSMYSGGMYGGVSNGMYPPGPMGLLSKFGQAPMSLMNGFESSVQAFGRLSQLLHMNFEALHMSFGSVVRLLDGFMMLRHELFNTMHTFTALKFLYTITHKLRTMLAKLTGTTPPPDLDTAWLNSAAPTMIGPDGRPVPPSVQQQQQQSGSVWGWIPLAISIYTVYTVCKYIFNKIRNYLYPVSADEFVQQQQQQQQAQPAHIDPALQVGAGHPAGMVDSTVAAGGLSQQQPLPYNMAPPYQYNGGMASSMYGTTPYQSSMYSSPMYGQSMYGSSLYGPSSMYPSSNMYAPTSMYNQPYNTYTPYNSTQMPNMYGNGMY